MADPILLIENFFYCFVRFVGLVMIMPYIGSNSLPTKTKAFLAYLVGLVCFLSLPPSAYVQASHDVEMLIIVVKEFVVGMIMGMGVKVVTETLMFAGQIDSTPMGLS
ncbi:flagellar biosynthetic protein FliR, partial [bacterium]|nr:flagellar biosynthetic protein FliR [bacterium]